MNILGNLLTNPYAAIFIITISVGLFFCIISIIYNFIKKWRKE